jgi:hypothetical protein
VGEGEGLGRELGVGSLVGTGETVAERVGDTEGFGEAVGDGGRGVAVGTLLAVGLGLGDPANVPVGLGPPKGDPKAPVLATTPFPPLHEATQVTLSKRTVITPLSMTARNLCRPRVIGEYPMAAVTNGRMASIQRCVLKCYEIAHM